MKIRLFGLALMLAAASGMAEAGELTIVSLRDMHDVELRSAGITVPQRMTVHIQALGGGGDYGWSYKTDRMFAYGWIVNADDKSLVWRMAADNTSKSKDDRSFDGTVTLEPGNYEVYFTAYAFVYHSAFSHIEINIDHRDKSLTPGRPKKSDGFMSWFKDIWSGDIGKEWDKRSHAWGIDLLVDESVASSVTNFSAPREIPNTVVKAIGVGDSKLIRTGFTLAERTRLQVYALGETGNEGDLADYGWIVSIPDRQRVWEMRPGNTSWAGGAKKNIKYKDEVELGSGSYVLYYITDGTHSAADWNAEPPTDPLDYGITVSVPSERDKKLVKTFAYDEDKNLIVSLTKVRDNEYRSEGFTLKEPAKVRIYAFGERSNTRYQMADYGLIMDAKTRSRVWTMDLDRTYPGGGASKNRFVDEVIPLQKGSYIVTYQTDDSHAYDAWNDDPPFDPDHYGISVMGAGEKFNPAIVSKYVETRDKNVIAQIVRVGNNADRTEAFALPRTTRIRIYAIGEGRDREMYDYGWIEDAKTGSTVWEMTYGMTFHAGGGRKNRMVNTTIILEKGSYRLRWRSDDSHSFGDWNVDPPDDPQSWGITLYRDEGGDRPPIPPVPPARPGEPVEDDE